MSAAALTIAAPSLAANDADTALYNSDRLLGKLCKYYEEAETQSIDAREAAQRDRDYKDGKQWTEEEAAELRRRGQPLVWNNIIGRKVELLRGIERRGRSDPKAFPRTPVEDVRADAATQALRYIADQNRFDVIRSLVYDNMLVEGMGGCEVIVEANQQSQDMLGTTALTPPKVDYDVIINHLPWDRVFFDPHSQHPGFTDARYLGMVIWMDREEALERYPGCEDILNSTFEGYRFDSFDDKPKLMWSDSKRRRIRVAQIWYKQGPDWWTATFTKGGFLEDPMQSPYLDRHGNGHCPLILRSAHIDRQNNRFGVVRDLVPLQDSINKRESKLLHSLSVNQLHFEDGAVEDEDQARVEAAKPDGVLKLNPGFMDKFKIHKDTAEIQGQFQLLQYAQQQINLAGPNAAMAGKDPRELSGRAILAQQSGGMLENEALVDELRQWTHKVWEAAWMRVRQFWTTERWIRVTDNDNKAQFVGLNRPVTIASLLANLDRSAPLPMQLQALQPDDARAIMFGMQLPPGDPRLQMPIRIENDIGDMDVDITVEEGPDNPTVKHEAWQQFVSLPPQVLVNFPPEAFVQMNPGLGADDKQRMLTMLQEHAQANAQAQQHQQATADAMAQAKIADTQASAAQKQASAAEKVHNIAYDHAEALHTPVMPGVGPVAPEINPLLQPSPMAPQQSA